MPTKDEIKNFSMMIEEMALQLKCDYLDAILHHCKESSLEVEVASTLLSSSLKSKIREQAENNNQLKKRSRLPI
jgi:hypothetical protein